MAKPRILIIENSIDVTGALKSITRTACDLSNYFDFYFLIPSNSRGRFWIEEKGFSSIEELPMRELSRRISSLLLYVPFLINNTFRLHRILKQKSIDIVHVNDLYNLLPVIMKMIGSKVPYICHIRFLPNHFPTWLFNFWLRLQLKYADSVVAVSQSVLNMLPDHPKLMLIHDKLPEEELYPPLRRPVDQSHRTFLYLSNFIIGKGQNYALESFAKVHQSLPEWKLRFVGGDLGILRNQGFRISLQERASELGIFEKTEWLGFTNDVESEYKAADIMLNFSESESFSITCLESLFFGCPVIATDCGGPAEIIENEKTGILVSNRDVDEMAEAMRKLASSEEIRISMRASGRDSVRDRFGVENTSLKIRKQYQRIFNGIK